MKPQDLYRGQAPAAMGMMGQGLMEAGANIGRSTLAGYQALGQGLASGVEQAANAYQEKKKLDAQNKADEGFVKTMLPYLPESVRGDFAARHEDLLSDPSASALDKAAFYHSAKSYLGQSIANSMDIEKAAALAKYNPAWSEVDAKNEYYKAQAEALRRKAEPVPVMPFGAHFGETAPVPVEPPAQDALLVPSTYQGNFDQPAQKNRYKLQMGLPQGYGDASMGLFGR